MLYQLQVIFAHIFFTLNFRRKKTYLLFCDYTKKSRSIWHWCATGSLFVYVIICVCDCVWERVCACAYECIFEREYAFVCVIISVWGCVWERETERDRERERMSLYVWWYVSVCVRLCLREEDILCVFVYVFPKLNLGPVFLWISKQSVPPFFNVGSKIPMWKMTSSEKAEIHNEKQSR